MLSFLLDEDGQSMVEYGLILGLVVLIALAVATIMGPHIKSFFSAADRLFSSES